jgi:preprotein translocase subunit SecD
MSRILMWKGLVILAVVATMGFSAWPPGEKVKLGLDLQGGMHLVLGVQVADALRADRDRVMERFSREASAAGITGARLEPRTDTSFAATGISRDQEAAIREIAADHLADWRWRWEGDRLIITLDDTERSRLEDMAVRQALQTIRNRVDAFGVSEPVIQRQGFTGDRIIVQLPGVDDPERVKELIKSTAFLEFRLVDFPLGGGGVDSRDAILAHYEGRVPENIVIMEGDVRDREGNVIGTRYYGVEGRSVITGRELRNARPSLGQFNDPIVEFMLTHEGGRRFAEATGANIGRGLAIILDGRVVSAPNIESRISDSGIIRGQFTQAEVEDLATVLRTGALPAGLVIMEERTVGPSLGQDSIDSGLRAGLVGMLLVVLAIFFVYKLTGINAITALSLNVIIIFGALAYFGGTLTLPGIAGIILTIGMAVDANVLIFERIREELRSGRTVRSAIENGFEKAFSSIVDANITTLLAAMFLFQFGTGPIRGFAVTLAIGIMASMFTALFVSRWIFEVLLQTRSGRLERLSI